jgi:rhamnulokinase
MEELWRTAHAPVRASDGSLRWDWDGLVAGVVSGLSLGLSQGPVDSIGIDTWGVDYGLLAADGSLVAPPYAYRDSRTSDWQSVVARIGADTLYRTTGVQLMAINTVFQLAAHSRAELDRAASVVLLPELLVHVLTGVVVGERTSAGTTALVDLATGDWSRDLLEAIDVDPSLMPRIGAAGSPVGTWRGVPVHLVGGHDTASAVAALPGPPPPGAAFVSSGTWLLVGMEREKPDVSDAARAANFSNEMGALGGVRFLKNVMGLWMLEECRRAWGSPEWDGLLAAAAAVGPGGPVVDATDARFLAPDDMEAEVRLAAGLPASAGRDRVARCILDSLARSTADVVGELESLTGMVVPEIVVVGGGSRNGLLNRLLAEAAGVPVRVGPAEATALGNALVQAVALGRYPDLATARAALA